MRFIGGIVEGERDINVDDAASVVVFPIVTEHGWVKQEEYRRMLTDPNTFYWVPPLGWTLDYIGHIGFDLPGEKEA